MAELDGSAAKLADKMYKLKSSLPPSIDRIFDPSRQFVENQKVRFAAGCILFFRRIIDPTQQKG